VVSGRSISSTGDRDRENHSGGNINPPLFHRRGLAPYAVEVDGQIITVYDSVLHQRVEKEGAATMTAAGSFAGGRASWWAGIDYQYARTAVQCQHEVLRRAGPDEGQQRHADHRRFRTPARQPGGTSEPLGGSARSPDRLPYPGRREKD